MTLRDNYNICVRFRTPSSLHEVAKELMLLKCGVGEDS